MGLSSAEMGVNREMSCTDGAIKPRACNLVIFIQMDLILMGDKTAAPFNIQLPGQGPEHHDRADVLDTGFGIFQPCIHHIACTFGIGNLLGQLHNQIPGHTGYPGNDFRGECLDIFGKRFISKSPLFYKGLIN